MLDPNPKQALAPAYRCGHTRTGDPAPPDTYALPAECELCLTRHRLAAFLVHSQTNGLPPLFPPTPLFNSALHINTIHLEAYQHRLKVWVVKEKAAALPIDHFSEPVQEQIMSAINIAANCFQEKTAGDEWILLDEQLADAISYLQSWLAG